MRAVIRPESDAAADSTDGPFMPTAAMPSVPDPSDVTRARPRAKTTEQSALAMTECPACHIATPVARFCTSCGGTLVLRNFCSDCGGRLRPLAKFCDGCGLKVP